MEETSFHSYKKGSPSIEVYQFEGMIKNYQNQILSDQTCLENNSRENKMRPYVVKSNKNGVLFLKGREVFTVYLS